ncbi:hypothetical protein [Nonomuraea sp. NPDC046570]|uniref:hypothetical protein n=1 Tax=Nonomuraea sp. NPDC046570 TaxID=3155255 RepID=UPI0033FBD7B6
MWIERQSDASDVSDLEVQYVQPLAEFVIEGVIPVRREGDVHFMINSLIWCVHEFVLSGVFDAAGRRRGPDDPRALSRFRAHIHHMIHRTLGLPGSPPEPLTFFCRRDHSKVRVHPAGDGSREASAVARHVCLATGSPSICSLHQLRNFASDNLIM